MSTGNVEMVMSLTGCGEEEAKSALAKHTDVLAAVDSLLVIPSASGQKFVPEKPKINDGLSDEVRANLKRAREFADVLNASPRNDLRQTQSGNAVQAGSA